MPKDEKVKTSFSLSDGVRRQPGVGHDVLLLVHAFAANVCNGGDDDDDAQVQAHIPISQANMNASPLSGRMLKQLFCCRRFHSACQLRFSYMKI